MGIKEIKDCAGSALELGDAIEKLNLSNFGVDRIGGTLNKFQDSCKVSNEGIKIINTNIIYGITDLKNEKPDWAINSFKLAREQVFSRALINIKEKF